MKTCGIYCITHVASGRRYIGQSRDVAARLRQHAKGTERSAIGAAVRKYGWSAFSAELLEQCELGSLNEREVKWIASLGTLSPAGFNLTTGGNQNKEVADEVRQIVSARTRAAMTPEMLERRRERMLGVPKSAEWRAAMSKRQKGADNVARLTAMARAQSPEARAKIAASKIGKPLAAETKAKLSAAAKDRGAAAVMRASPNYMSAETRAKMSAAAKARCARRAEV